MSFNVVQSTIDFYLSHLSDDDERLRALLRVALLRPLSRELPGQERPDNLTRLTRLPDDAPGWLSRAFAEGAAVYCFAPDARMRDELRHVADWLKAALHNEDAWLRDCDAQGRPKKLLKLGTVAQAVREADKAMLLFSHKAAAQPYTEGAGERTVMTFADGFRIVQLLTPEALDRESAFLGHCVGHGGYDNWLRGGTCLFYSLRDPQGRGHATMEVHAAENTLLQCKGKQNRPPVTKYMPHIQAFLRREAFTLRERVSMTGLIKAGEEYHDIHRLPEGLRIGGTLDLSGTGITALPEGLSVGGTLDLRGTGITALPAGLSVGGGLYLSGTGITALPEGLSVGGTLYLRGTGITALPADLRVKGSIFPAIDAASSAANSSSSLSFTSTSRTACPL